MSTLHMVAQSIGHPTTNLTIEILQRSTSTSLLTTVTTINEWITTVDIEVDIDPQILAAKDVEVRMTPEHANPSVHLYQMILTANKIWRLSSTISHDLGIDVDDFLPKKVIMTATVELDLDIAGAVERPRAVLFASAQDDLQASAVLSAREIAVSGTVEDDYLVGVQEFTV